MDDLELHVAWAQHVGAGDEAFDEVVARHREPHRQYHGVRHVRWVVHHVRHLVARAVPGAIADVDVGAVVAAAFYHDAVYDPARADNEPRSAELAAGVLARAGWPAGRVDHVASMIRATTGHDDTTELGTAVLLAADLAVLAADPAAYEAYRVGVRHEYGHVGDDDWRRGRSAVLAAFAARPAIYPPALALTEWEQRARANIAAELASLGE